MRLRPPRCASLRTVLVVALAAAATLASAAPALAGGMVVMGADPDYHASPALSNNTGGARRLLQLSIAHVTEGQTPPRVLLVTDTRNPGGDEQDSRLGLAAAGFAFDVADDGAAGAPVLDLETVDFGAYDAVVVASDFGGWLRQEQVDILNQRRDELAAYVAAGGGLVVLGESGSRKRHVGVDQGRYQFVPTTSALAAVTLDQHQKNATVTEAGRAFGLTKADITQNAVHAYFVATGDLDVLSADQDGRPIILATPKAPAAEPTPVATPTTTPTVPVPPDQGDVGGFTEQCLPTLGFRSVGLRPAEVDGRNGVQLRFQRRLRRPVRVEVYQHSVGRKILRKRLIARFTKQTRTVAWDGRAQGVPPGTAHRPTDGYYVVRYVMGLGRGRGTDVRRRTLLRKDGAFFREGPKSTRLDCRRVRSVRLRRPVFGGTDLDPLLLSYKVRRRASLAVTISRGRRVVRTEDLGMPALRRRVSLVVNANDLRRGVYRLTLTSTDARGRTRIAAVLRIIRL